MNVYLRYEVTVGTVQEPLVLKRYLACWLWSSKVALWTDDVRKAWWGDLATAYKIQDQWGPSSPLRAVDKKMHLAELLDRAKTKRMDATYFRREDYTEAEWTVMQEERRRIYAYAAHIERTIEEVGAE